MLELLPALNDKNLPWLDVIHPIVVHFVIAMALISVVFDLIGVVATNPRLLIVTPGTSLNRSHPQPSREKQQEGNRHQELTHP